MDEGVLPAMRRQLGSVTVRGARLGRCRVPTPQHAAEHSKRLTEGGEAMRSSPSEAVLVAPVDEQRDHIRGSADAPITLVQYGDFECPYCGQAYPIIKQIAGRMGDRLRFVLRNFPIPTSHPHAQQAAEAAEAADAQGRFWEMHDLLYERQRHLSDEDLRTYADQLGLDV